MGAKTLANYRPWLKEKTHPNFSLAAYRLCR
jgi:hypothetical protein